MHAIAALSTSVSLVVATLTFGLGIGKCGLVEGKGLLPFVN